MTEQKVSYSVPQVEVGESLGFVHKSSGRLVSTAGILAGGVDGWKEVSLVSTAGRRGPMVFVMLMFVILDNVEHLQ